MIKYLYLNNLKLFKFYIFNIRYILNLNIFQKKPALYKIELYFTSKFIFFYNLLVLINAIYNYIFYNYNIYKFISFISGYNIKINLIFLYIRL